MHALSGCDTVSYPYGKGKKSALKVLMNTDIDGLQDALGEPDISQGQLKATAGAFFLALYGQKKTDSVNTARNISQQHQPTTTIAKLRCSTSYSASSS